MIEIEWHWMLLLLVLLALAVYGLVWLGSRKLDREWPWSQGYGP